ncbi:MAG TPA: cytochrome c [Candidatus Acidoferrum sp.]|nr:cytochrome c [Candidatus Acidoferrum sp.]
MMQISWIKRIGLVLGTVAVSGLLAAQARSNDKTAALYKQKCAVCHGANGKATAAGQKMGGHDFDSAEVKKLSDDELVSAIDKGVGKMPAYGKSLKPEQIKDLVAYIRSMAK